MALDVIGDGRLFEPTDVVLGQGPRRADRLLDTPAHVGIDQQRYIRPQQLAHRRDPLEILAEPWPANLHLDRLKTLGEIVFGLLQQLVEGELQIDTTGIGRDVGIMAAQEAPERHAVAPCRQIPKRGVDGGDREGGEPAAPDEVQMPPHPLPQRFDPIRLLAKQERLQIALDQVLDRAAAGTDGVGIAEPLRAVVGAQANGDQLEMGHLAMGRIRQGDR